MKTKTTKVNVKQWHLLRNLWAGQYIQARQSPTGWRFRVRDGNHEIVCTSEAYTRREKMMKRQIELFPDLTNAVYVSTLANKLSRQPYAKVVAKQKPAKSE